MSTPMRTSLIFATSIAAENMHGGPKAAILTPISFQGMVDAAVYIDRKLREEGLLSRAFNLNKERGTDDFDRVCVGHSLGAGAAAILAIMLKQEFPRTRGFVYSPPGGTLR